ncbi:hypothetical protein ACFQ1I_46735 [Kitasatospora arboriphila]
MVSLPGSKRAAAPDARRTGDVDESQPIDITLVLRRRAEIPEDLINGPATISRQELAERYGADPADIDLVRRTAEEHGLHVLEADQATRRIKLRGTLAQLRHVADPQSLDLVQSLDPATREMVEHRQREGDLRIPAHWQDVVVAVLGMDDRPQARPHIHRLKPPPPTGATRPWSSARSTASRRTPTAAARRSPSSNWAAATPRTTWTRTSQTSASHRLPA